MTGSIAPSQHTVSTENCLNDQIFESFFKQNNLIWGNFISQITSNLNQCRLPQNKTDNWCLSILNKMFMLRHKCQELYFITSNERSYFYE